MGSNLVRRLVPAGHERVLFDLDQVAALEAEGSIGADSPDQLVEMLDGIARWPARLLSSLAFTPTYIVAVGLEIGTAAHPHSPTASTTRRRASR